MKDVPYYFIERIRDRAWLTGAFQWTHDPNEAWKTIERVVLEEIVEHMFRNRCIVTEHLFIDTPTEDEWDIDNKSYRMGFNDGFDCGRTQYPKRVKPFEWATYESKPVAFEWHNFDTGHCYVDYIPHPNQDEKDGYKRRPLYK